MSFLWPTMLWLMASLPLLVLGYLLQLRRRRRFALQHASLSMLQQASAAGGAVGSTLRRHLPAVLLLGAIGLLVAAMARPVSVVHLPTRYETVILAIDVSGSMAADDIKPTRIAAAQAAAKAFIEDQPASTRIGIVTFAGSASLVQPPTQSRDELNAAIERFQLQRATALGSGLVVALATIFPDAGLSVAALEQRGRGARGTGQGTGQGQGAAGPQAGADSSGRGGTLGPGKPPFEPVPAGSYGSAVIVLLTDGQASTGPDPLEAAKLAAERGVRVYTVGVGTPKGTVLRNEGWSMRVLLDEATLQSIARMTQGEYFQAGTGEDLKKIYRSLDSRFRMEPQRTEITALFAAGAALMALLGAGLSLLWFNRIV